MPPSIPRHSQPPVTRGNAYAGVSKASQRSSGASCAKNVAPSLGTYPCPAKKALREGFGPLRGLKLPQGNSGSINAVLHWLVSTNQANQSAAVPPGQSTPGRPGKKSSENIFDAGADENNRSVYLDRAIENIAEGSPQQATENCNAHQTALTTNPDALLPKVTDFLLRGHTDARSDNHAQSAADDPQFLKSITGSPALAIEIKDVVKELQEKGLAFFSSSDNKSACFAMELVVSLARQGNFCAEDMSARLIDVASENIVNKREQARKQKYCGRLLRLNAIAARRPQAGVRRYLLDRALEHGADGRVQEALEILKSASYFPCDDKSVVDVLQAKIDESLQSQVPKLPIVRHYLRLLTKYRAFESSENTGGLSCSELGLDVSNLWLQTIRLCIRNDDFDVLRLCLKDVENDAQLVQSDIAFSALEWLAAEAIRHLEGKNLGGQKFSSDLQEEKRRIQGAKKCFAEIKKQVNEKNPITESYLQNFLAAGDKFIGQSEFKSAEKCLMFIAELSLNTDFQASDVRTSWISVINGHIAKKDFPSVERCLNFLQASYLAFGTKGAQLKCIFTASLATLSNGHLDKIEKKWLDTLQSLPFFIEQLVTLNADGTEHELDFGRLDSEKCVPVTHLFHPSGLSPAQAVADASGMKRAEKTPTETPVGQFDLEAIESWLHSKRRDSIENEGTQSDLTELWFALLVAHLENDDVTAFDRCLESLIDNARTAYVKVADDGGSILRQVVRNVAGKTLVRAAEWFERIGGYTRSFGLDVADAQEFWLLAVNAYINTGRYGEAEMCLNFLEFNGQDAAVPPQKREWNAQEQWDKLDANSSKHGGGLASQRYQTVLTSSVRAEGLKWLAEKLEAQIARV